MNAITTCNISNYTHAIVQNIPSLLSRHDGLGFDFTKAEDEHRNFVGILKQILPVIEFEEEILKLGAVCLESAFMIYHGTAILTRAKINYSIDFLKFLLKNSLSVIEVSDSTIKLDGSDVLFTGNEFFVGITDWTNEKGASFLAYVYPEYPVTPIFLQKKRNLKYYISMARPGVLCYSDNDEAKRIAIEIAKITCYNYKELLLHEETAAQVLHVNGRLIHRSSLEIPNSIKALEDFNPKIAVKFEELGKPAIGTHFSSYCILFVHPNKIQSI